MDVLAFLDYGWNILEWLLRILVAGLCGGLVGAERSKRFKDAGVRTHCVVAMSAAVFMIISKYAFADISAGTNGVNNADASRIASQVVTGISFIGAGAIFKNGSLVRGITTAAGIWATSAIGMAIGSGLYVIGIVATVLVLVVQFIMHKIKIGADAVVLYNIDFTVKNGNEFRAKIQQFFLENDATIDEIKMETSEGVTKFSYVVKFNKRNYTDPQKHPIFLDENVLGFKIKKM